MLGGEALEHVSACGAYRTESGPIVALLADAVEDDHATGAAQRDEARELVDELARVVVTSPAWSRL